MKIILTILVVTTFIGVVVSCTYHKGEELVPIGPPVHFELEIKPIIISNCLICHADTSTNPDKNPNMVWFLKGPNHDDFSELQEYALMPSINSAYTIMQQRIHGYDGVTRMPYQRAALPDTIIAKLDRWIRQGAPVDN
ncbi:MAG: hypothetical protein JWM14_2867 [Chitinophagaceae bacterium]|nr:hypothetical protein [Chitinophagaceae bacterium]